VIEALEPSANEEMVPFIAGLVHDKSFEVTHQLQERLSALGVTPSPLVMNFFL
jgi:hypothetical protein